MHTGTMTRHQTPTIDEYYNKISGNNNKWEHQRLLWICFHSKQRYCWCTFGCFPAHDFLFHNFLIFFAFWVKSFCSTVHKYQFTALQCTSLLFIFLFRYIGLIMSVHVVHSFIFIYIAKIYICSVVFFFFSLEIVVQSARWVSVGFI